MLGIINKWNETPVVTAIELYKHAWKQQTQLFIFGYAPQTLSCWAHHSLRTGKFLKKNMENLSRLITSFVRITALSLTAGML